MTTFSIIGLVGDEAAEYLESGQDLCFGKYYAKSVYECINCRAPVVMNNKLFMMKELCAMKCVGDGSVARLNRLSAREVMERLERGVPLYAIFREILGSAPPGQLAAEARQLLVDRVLYLKTAAGFDAGSIPRTKDLLGEKR